MSFLKRLTLTAIPVAVVGTIAATLAVGLANAQSPAAHPGQAVYKQYCADCHDANEDERTPTFASLRAMPEPALRAALTEGVMKPIADAIPRPQYEQLIGYLTGKPATPAPAAQTQAPAAGRGAPAAAVDVSWIEKTMCAADQRTVDLSGPKTFTSFGVTPQGDRSLTARAAGLTNRDLSNLEVAWTLAIPGANGVGNQGAVVGNTLFYSAPTIRRVFALDTKTGCIKWAYEPAAGGLRTSVVFGKLGETGPEAVVFGDGQGHIQALDARTGKLIWRAPARTPIRGAPIIYKDKIIVPISANDVGAAGNPAYECCKNHGAVVALNAADGKTLWVYETMENSKPLEGRKNSRGVQMYGPSGAPIWASPVIDVKRNAVIATTGENTSPPATATSDSIISIDLDTGKANWVFQALGNDIWNMACPSGGGTNFGPNCFFNEKGESLLLDHDFGGQGFIATGPGGKDVVVAGQKSGDLWAVDAATGKKVWNVKFGQGTALGGIHWGIAGDGRTAYAPINDPTYPGMKAEPGMNAVDIRTGKTKWRWAAKADCAGERKARITNCETKYGLSVAPVAIDKAVVAGSLDGKVYVFNAADGKVLATYDTAVAYTNTLNGVAGKGGSIDSHALFAGDGMLFVGSGYGSFNQTPGNVLVAYRPKK